MLRRGDEALYSRAAGLFRRHVECAWDAQAGGVYRGVRMSDSRYLVDEDCKVKWAHDEVCVGCAMLIAHPPTPDVGAEADGGVPSESTAQWAARSLCRVRCAQFDHPPRTCCNPQPLMGSLHTRFTLLEYCHQPAAPYHAPASRT